MALKVLQWSTGRVGSASARGVLAHPALTLAGVGVYDDTKAGRDAGEIVGGEATGLRAVPVRDLIGMEADCVLHNPKGEFAPDDAVADICALLESGKNVCSTAVMSLVHPRTMAPEHKARIEAACAAGRSTFHATGINPGFFADVMTMTVSGLSHSIEHVHAIEIYDYRKHTSRTTVVELLKFGRPPQEAAQPRAYRVGPAEPGMHMLADAMGIALDEVRRERQERQADEPFDIAATHVAAGTHAAHRYLYTGLSGGEERIRFEFIGRAAPHVAPDWPAPAREGLHRWENRVRGAPDVVSSVEIGLNDPQGVSGATATAMRAVNAVEAVCAAPPGIVTILDLGLLRGSFRR